jgi:hypothetical protein
VSFFLVSQATLSALFASPNWVYREHSGSTSVSFTRRPLKETMLPFAQKAVYLD